MEEEEEKEEDLIYLKLVRFHTFPRQEERSPQAIFPAVACFSFRGFVRHACQKSMR